MNQANKPTYYLAVDIGASSGRHILSWIEDGKIKLEEVYRFKNGAKMHNGHLEWETDALLQSVLEGMAACKACGKIPTYMGIDTWGVDYALLNESGKRIGEVTAYRDSRTAGMDQKLQTVLSESALYARTGIQKQPFNTVYQLMAHKEQHPEELAAARCFLMMPDYLAYALTGRVNVEYTDASTTGMLDAATRDWDYALLESLSIPTAIFPKPQAPGTTLGHLLPEVAAKVGYDLIFISVTSHDTAAAVLACPCVRSDAAYLSSGTWSLMGVELPHPLQNEASRTAGFTNEGGYDGTYRYLKNIMGLWMIQSIRHECNDAYSFAELSAMARACGDVPYRVNVNDQAFLAPKSMIEAVKTVAGVPDMPLEQVLATVYYSLAQAYKQTLDELEVLTGKPMRALYIMGGGSQDTYLNELTAKISGREVYTGVVEATAIGNVLCMMLATGVFGKTAEARQCVADSFELKKVEI